MRNESSNIMRRELFREYQVNDILKIYQIHRGNLFVTLPFGPIRDFQTLNGCRIAESRKEKFLLLSEIGVLLEYASNAYSCWVKYAKESIRRRRQRDQDEEEQEVDPEFRRFQAH